MDGWAVLKAVLVCWQFVLDDGRDLCVVCIGEAGRMMSSID